MLKLILMAMVPLILMATVPLVVLRLAARYISL